MTRAALLRLAAGEGRPGAERRRSSPSGRSGRRPSSAHPDRAPPATLDGAPLAAGGSDPWTRRLALALERHEQELVAAASTGE